VWKVHNVFKPGTLQYQCENMRLNVDIILKLYHNNSDKKTGNVRIT